MKKTDYPQNWASGFLGVVCLVLFMNLILRGNGSVEASLPARPAPIRRTAQRLPTISPKVEDGLPGPDLVVQLNVLKELEARPLPRLGRNPFEFEAPPVAPRPGGDSAKAPPPGTTPSTGPPQVSLQSMGYAEKAGGTREAFISDGDEIYIVHEGEDFAKRFHVVKITSALVEVLDGTSGQKLQLPFSQ